MFSSRFLLGCGLCVALGAAGSAARAQNGVPSAAPYLIATSAPFWREAAAPASAQYRRGDGFRRRGDLARRYGRSHAPTAGIGAQIAAWNPEDIGETDALIRGHARAYLNRQAAIQGEVGYFSHGSVGPDILLAPNAHNSRIRDIPVGASLLYFFRPSGGRHHRAGASLYGGLGVDWHLLEETFDAPGPLPHQTDTATAFGHHVIVGLEVGNPAGANIFGEYRYNDGEEVSLNGLPFDFHGSSVGAGISVNF